jgi:hypothetical protein
MNKRGQVNAQEQYHRGYAEDGKRRNKMLDPSHRPRKHPQAGLAIVWNKYPKTSVHVKFQRADPVYGSVRRQVVAMKISWGLSEAEVVREPIDRGPQWVD